MTELVSIVMPAYHSAAFIRDSLNACLAQTYRNLEIIVVDDGSTDDTLRILQSYGEKITVLQQANSGPAIARNTGIEAAKGEFIQFCDSDDILHPEKITKCVAILHENPNAALAFCQMQAIDENGITIADTAPVPDASYFENNDLFCQMLHANGSPIQTSTILARKSALESVGKYRADPDHRCAEDWDLLLRLADDYQFVGISEVLVDYRKRSGALSYDNLAMAEGRLKTVQYARHYSKRKSCFSDSQYNDFEATRYHRLATVYWQNDDKQAARQAFLMAANLSPKSAFIRRVYAFMTLLFPIKAMYRLNQLLSAIH